MAGNNENLGSVNINTDVPAKASGDKITADTYRQMLDILESLASHNHIFYDDYTTVCECQCQCDCSRGTL
jgi:hypothetical protein